MTWLKVLYAHRNPHAEAAITIASGTKRIDPRPAPRGGQAADGNTQKARHQHDVGEERQEDDRAAQPADARQLEEKNHEADQEELDARSRRGLARAGIGAADSLDAERWLTGTDHVNLPIWNSTDRERD